MVMVKHMKEIESSPHSPSRSIREGTKNAIMKTKLRHSITERGDQTETTLKHRSNRAQHWAGWSLKGSRSE